MSTVFGSDLKVGDTIKVWWQPNRDRIVGLYPYVGPLEYLFPEGAQTAAFALNKCGMTIDNNHPYEVIDGKVD